MGITFSNEDVAMKSIQFWSEKTFCSQVQAFTKKDNPKSKKQEEVMPPDPGGGGAGGWGGGNQGQSSDRSTQLSLAELALFSVYPTCLLLLPYQLKLN